MCISWVVFLIRLVFSSRLLFGCIILVRVVRNCVCGLGVRLLIVDFKNINRCCFFLGILVKCFLKFL